jgi:uncharacterized membrane protein YgaE (UPF0421/DUF939 family)
LTNTEREQKNSRKRIIRKIKKQTEQYVRIKRQHLIHVNASLNNKEAFEKTRKKPQEAPKKDESELKYWLETHSMRPVYHQSDRDIVNDWRTIVEQSN